MVSSPSARIPPSIFSSSGQPCVRGSEGSCRANHPHEAPIGPYGSGCMSKLLVYLHVILCHYILHAGLSATHGQHTHRSRLALHTFNCRHRNWSVRRWSHHASDRQKVNHAFMILGCGLMSSLQLDTAPWHPFV